MAKRSKTAGPSPHEMANAIRALAMDAVEAANSGHPGMPMGMADVATVLFTKFMKFDVSAPDWPDRDRFVLSAGHGSMLLYALLYLTGMPGMEIGDIERFRQLGSKTAGHPEFGYAPGIETTTGPLGQGLGNAAGMAIAERLSNARYGPDICDHYTYVIAGDGCLMEGISHEAADLAGHLRLNKLIVLFDDNSVSIDGATNLATSADQLKRFEALGWAASSVDGHDPKRIEAAISDARKQNRPSLIACRTVIGYGAPHKQGTAAAHGPALGADEVAAARVRLGWDAPPFQIPAHILETWRRAGQRSSKELEKWTEAHAALAPAVRGAFDRTNEGALPTSLAATVGTLKAKWLVEKPKFATRQSSQATLEALTAIMPELIGGSADLTASNGTRVTSHAPVSEDDFSGSYIHYGVREHGMAAAMNGIALHGGFIPYGGTFLVFSDYCRPAIRLSALMHQRVIYVMTHDSIGVGEDGPTHQPVEQLASLRAMPNCLVFRPADAVETLEAWECALHATDRPSVLCLTRQGLPALRTASSETELQERHPMPARARIVEGEPVSQPQGQTHGLLHRRLTHPWAERMPAGNLTARGAYVAREPAARARQMTLLATGSEVAIAIEAADKLAKDDFAVAVVSMPSWELFRQQPEDYRQRVLGTAPRIGIETAVKSGWHEWLGERGAFIGMESFGASGPAGELYAYFGITSDAVVKAARALIRET